jgi:hypothetical protein
MSRLMEAILMFDGPADRDRAIPRLVERGFEIELLNEEDRYEGVLLSETVWIIARGSSDLAEDDFFHEMQALAERLDAECLEAGFADPQPPAETTKAAAP